LEDNSKSQKDTYKKNLEKEERQDTLNVLTDQTLNLLTRIIINIFILNYFVYYKVLEVQVLGRFQ